MSRLELEGMLQRLRMERVELMTKAEIKIRAIKHALSMATITPLDEIDVEGVHALSCELLAIKKGMIDSMEKTKKIERELNG